MKERRQNASKLTSSHSESESENGPLAGPIVSKAPQCQNYTRTIAYHQR